VTAATTVEPTATSANKATTATNRTPDDAAATANRATMETATADRPATEAFTAASTRNDTAAIPYNATSIAVAAAIPVSCISIAAAIAIPAVSITAAEPRPHADKDAAVEPSRTIVAIRRAGIRRVVVVAVSAHRRSIAIGLIHWPADSHANRNLRVCGNRR